MTPARTFRFLALAACLAWSLAASAQGMIRRVGCYPVAFPETATTVAHVYWRSSSLMDRNTWTAIGTTAVTDSHPVRAPWARKAGPFGANYYGGTPAGVLATAAGDVTVCAVVDIAANFVTDNALMNVGSGAENSGWTFGTGASDTKWQFDTWGAAASLTRVQSSAFTHGVAGPRIVCAGRDVSGNTQLVRAYGGSVASAAAPKNAAGAAHADIGTRTSVLPWGGFIYEIWVSTDKPSDAAFTLLLDEANRRLSRSSQSTCNRL